MLVSERPPTMNDPAPEEDLLERAQAGDQEAFQALFSRHRAALITFVRRRLDAPLRARVDVSDVIQETQLEAYRRLAAYVSARPMPFADWLERTAYERLVMLRRRHLGAARRSTRREQRIPERSSLILAERLIRAQSSPSQRVSRGETAQRVRALVDSLPEVDREILWLRSFEERSYEEIAEALGIESTAARKRHGRALLRLHALLVDAGLAEGQSGAQ